MAALGEVIGAAQAGTQAGAMEGQAIQQGMKSGMDYAMQQSQLDIHKQQLDQNQQYLDTYKKEFNTKVGRQMADDYNDFITLPEGPLKKTKGQVWAQTYQDAGLLDENTSDQWIAAGNEEKMKMDWPALYKGATGLEATDPKGYQSAMEQSRMMFGNKPTLDLFKNNSDKIIAMQAMKVGRGAQIDARETNAALKMAQKENDMGNTQLDNIARGKDFIADMGKKFKSTPQAFSQLQAEQNRVLQGAKGMTEGSQERQKADNWGNMLTKAVQFASNVPENTPMDAWVKQIGAEFDTMATSQMRAIDSKHEMIRGGFEGYPSAQGAVDAMYKGTRRANSRKERFGEWRGYNQDGTTPKEQQEETPAPKSAAAAQPADNTPDQMTPSDRQKMLQLKSAAELRNQRGDGPGYAKAILQIKQRYAKYPKDLQAAGIK